MYPIFLKHQAEAARFFFQNDLVREGAMLYFEQLNVILLSLNFKNNDGIRTACSPHDTLFISRASIDQIAKSKFLPLSIGNSSSVHFFCHALLLMKIKKITSNILLPSFLFLSLIKSKKLYSANYQNMLLILDDALNSKKRT